MKFKRWRAGHGERLLSTVVKNNALPRKTVSVSAKRVNSSPDRGKNICKGRLDVLVY